MKILQILHLQKLIIVHMYVNIRIYQKIRRNQKWD